MKKNRWGGGDCWHKIIIEVVQRHAEDSSSVLAGGMERMKQNSLVQRLLRCVTR